MKKISIISVTYNCKMQLKNTLNSFLSQTYDDVEYLIIDGNSTDGTVELIKKYAQHISYWISEPDKGIYDAMNKGLKAATGDYVLFLNAGDTFFSERTLEQIPLKKYPDADIFYGETVIVDEHGNALGLRQKSLPHHLTWHDFKKGMVVCHQSILVKREIAPLYNIEYRYSADIEWVLKSLKRSSQIIFTNTIISVFETGGFSSRNKWNSWKERWIIMKNNFGWLQCLFSHIVFIFDLFLLKLNLKPLFRKIDPELLINESTK